MPFKKILKSKRNKIFALVFTSLALVVAVAVSFFSSSLSSFNNSNLNQAFASDVNKEAFPGERFEISFFYGNEAGQDQGDTVANMEIRLGTTLEIEKIYDVFDTNGDGNFDNETKYEICKEYMAPMPLNSTNPLRRRMFYLPRSANNASQCSGTVFTSGTQYGNITLPQGNSETGVNFGKVVFQVRLKENILSMPNLATSENYQIGDLLNNDNFQGGYVKFQAGVRNRESDIVPSEGSYSIKIIEARQQDRPLTQSNMQDAIESIVCTPKTVAQNQSINCQGSLNTGYTQPGGNFELSIPGGGSSVCQFQGKNFTCNNINVGQTEGSKTVQGKVGNGTPQNMRETINVEAQRRATPITDANLNNGGLVSGQDFATATQLNCTQAIAGGQIQCTGKLPNGFKSPETGQLKLNVEGQAPVVCTFSNDVDFVCNNMPVGTETGQKKIQATTSNQPPKDTGKVIQAEPNTGGQVLLLPDTSISFTPNKNNPAVYGKQDLLVNINHTANITDCAIKVREYGTNNNWTTLQTQTNGKTCSTTFAKENQNQNKWEFSIEITDSEGKRWKSEPSYFMKLGAISIVEITSCIANEC
jgi:hypothetical protein